MIQKLVLSLAITAAMYGQIPRPAADFSVLLPTGKKVSLTEYKGKIVLLTGLLTT
jgi:hypothetical protein